MRSRFCGFLLGLGTAVARSRFCGFLLGLGAAAVFSLHGGTVVENVEIFADRTMNGARFGVGMLLEREFLNRGEAEAEVELVASDYHARSVRTLKLAPGERRLARVFMPKCLQNCDLRSLVVNGREIEKSELLKLDGNGAGTQAALFSPDAAAELDDTRGFPLRNWSLDPRAYCSYDRIFISENEFFSASPELRRTLIDAALFGTPLTVGFSSDESVRFGRLMVSPAAAERIRRDFPLVAELESKNESPIYRVPKSAVDVGECQPFLSWLVFGGLAAFALAVCPGAFILFRRGNRLKIYLLAPCISVAAVAVLGLLAVSGGGMSGRAAVSGIINLSEKEALALVAANVSYYCPMPPKAGLRFTAGTLAVPNGAEYYSYIEDNAGTITIADWIKPRQKANIDLKSLVEFDGGLNVLAADGDMLKVKNQLGVPLKRLVYRWGDDLFYGVGIAADGVAELRRSDYPRLDFAACVGRVSLSGQYAAELDVPWLIPVGSDEIGVVSAEVVLIGTDDAPPPEPVGTAETISGTEVRL